MESHSGPPISVVPLIIPGSILAIPSLDPIPASNVPTPALHGENELPTPPHMDNIPSRFSSGSDLNDYHTPPEDPNRVARVGSSSNPSAGSYFPTSPSAGLASYATTPAHSNETPGERPRPAQLSIPVNSPDEPIFSAYPDLTPGTSQQVRTYNFPLDKSFSLIQPPQRRQRGEEPALPALIVPEIKARSTRRPRATSLSFTQMKPRGPPAVRAQDPQTSQDSDSDQPPVSRNIARQRRFSLGGHEDEAHWQSFASINSGKARPLAFANADARYTTQPSSSGYSLLPLGPTPAIAPRRSSLSFGPRRSSIVHPTDVNAVILGLSNLDMDAADVTVHGITTDDLGITAVSESLPSLENVAFIEAKVLDQPIALSTVVAQDDQSLGSASISGTETNNSAGFFSTPTSSLEHPLSSTTTSLSRSTKSGKEGHLNEDKQTALSALRLQRSLEWEAKQKRRRQRLDQRRYILLELVETELAHTEGLKKLVHVYLPTLRRTFIIPEMSWRVIVRNIDEILFMHERILDKMVNVLREEGIGYDHGLEPILETQIDRAARRLVRALVDELPSFESLYTYSAGSSAAEAVIGRFRNKSEYTSFERLCSHSASSLDQNLTLRQMLEGVQPHVQAALSCPASPVREVANNRSRLKFEDHLILPVQRVCRYPLLLGTLNRSLQPISPEVEREQIDFPGDAEPADDREIDIDLVEAQSLLAEVARQTDEARRVRDEELKSELVIRRLDQHPVLSASFLQQLGTCRLIAAFDVLYSQQTSTTLAPSTKPKYLATFVYQGFMVFAKVKRATSYEVKHFFPLETSTIVYVDDGSLPFSLRVAIGDHFFDIGCSCKAEKDFLSETLSLAREEARMPPFAMPSSIPTFTSRPRRMSSVLQSDSLLRGVPDSETKRHTVTLSPVDVDFAQPPAQVLEDLEYVHSPMASPTRTSFHFAPDKRHHSMSTQKKPGVWVRKPNASQREAVDEAMADIFSLDCAKIRRGHELHHVLFFEGDVDTQPVNVSRTPSFYGTGSLLRRRKSMLDSRQSISDVTFVGEVRGSVIPVRHTRTHAGHRRTESQPGKRFTIGEGESATESETIRGAGSEVNDDGMSDFGQLSGRGLSTRTMSSMSMAGPASPPSRHMSKRQSLSNLRRGSEMGGPETGAALSSLFTLSRRKTMTASTLQHRRAGHGRAKSVPVSPVGLPVELPQLPTMQPPAVPHQIKTKRSNSALSSAAIRPVALRMSSITADDADDEASPIAGRADRSGTWTNIRRSMSFVFDKNSRPLGNSDDTLSSSRRPSSVAMSSSEESGSKEERETKFGDSEKEMGLDEPISLGTPRRRRSLRAGVFGGFSRFTPM